MVTPSSQLQPSADKAACALLRIRPKGLLKAFAIDPRAKGSAPVGKTFELPGDHEALSGWVAEQNRDLRRNVYFEPGIPRRGSAKKSTEADIVFSRYVCVDCDPKPDESAADAKKRHRQSLYSGKVPPPTFDWESGNGVVALWRRTKSIKLDRPESIARAKGENIAMARALGGKAEGYDNCQSLDHLFRIPYTVNYPDARKRALGRTETFAGNFHAHPQHRYDPEELPTLAMTNELRNTLMPIGEAVPVDDVSGLPVQDRIKEIIVHGRVKDETKEKDDTRSAWRFEAICAMGRAGIPPETIVGVLIDPQYEISSRALEFGDGAERYAQKEVERALRKLAAAKSKELEQDFGGEGYLSGAADDDATRPSSKVITPTLYVWTDPAKIPPRQWIYKPYYIRKFAGSTVATGGAGKSSLLLVEAVAMASGKDLLGVQPEPGLRVWYWNGEDPQDELQRRVQAIFKHYGIAAADIDGRLFLDSGRDLPIRIAELEDGKTKIAVPVVNQMIEAIRDYKIDCLGIDPWVSSHGVPENDNNAIDQVAKKWADIADKTNSHIHISHHTRKTNGMGAMAEDSRGASSLNNAMRTRRVINTMSSAEAEKAGILGNARLSYFKADTAGSSMTKPAEALEWYRFASVELGNGNGFDIDGDEVGVVVKWDYKPMGLELSSRDADAAIAALEVGGPWREQSRSAQWAGLAIAKVLGLDLEVKGVKKQVQAMLAEWLADGSIERYEAETSARQKKWFLRPVMDFD
jgi:hypothetical protein